MKQIALKQYYPAGGVSNEEIMISDITPTNRDGVLIGSAILPASSEAKKVIVYQLLLENKTFDYRVIPAHCPHQGADISEDLLKADGNVYCSWHRRPICVYSEYNQAFPVEKRGTDFIIVSRDSSSL